MPAVGHLKIAIATNSLTRVDVAFALSKQILFYDVTYDTAEFLDSARFAGGGAGKGRGRNGGDCWMMDTESTGGDRLTPRVEAVKGCQVLFAKSLGDLAAVRLHDHKVFPVKLENARDIDEVIAALQKMMNSPHPPLWLRKALGRDLNDGAYLIDQAV